MKQIEVVAGLIVQNNKILCTARGYGEFKGLFEFPGGKIEKNESKTEALKRELKEELKIDVVIGKFLCTVDYDYEAFHLTMHCFFCQIESGSVTLLEHEDAKWLLPSEMTCLKWLPADIQVIEKLKQMYS